MKTDDATQYLPLNFPFPPGQKVARWVTQGYTGAWREDEVRSVHRTGRFTLMGCGEQQFAQRGAGPIAQPVGKDRRRFSQIEVWGQKHEQHNLGRVARDAEAHLKTAVLDAVGKLDAHRDAPLLAGILGLLAKE